jgi:hypothetical protein
VLVFQRSNLTWIAFVQLLIDRLQCCRHRGSIAPNLLGNQVLYIVSENQIKLTKLTDLGLLLIPLL